MPHAYGEENVPAKVGGWRRIETLEEKSTPQHIMDFKLVEWGLVSLFYEYLEMVIQYGFIIIFVCAFPVAPFFVFCSNVLELRLDAKKTEEEAYCSEGEKYLCLV